MSQQHQRPPSMTGSQISRGGGGGEFNFNIIPNPVVEMNSSQISGVLIPQGGAASEDGTLSPAPSYILIPTNMTTSTTGPATDGRSRMSLVTITNNKFI